MCLRLSKMGKDDGYQAPWLVIPFRPKLVIGCLIGWRPSCITQIHLFLGVCSSRTDLSRSPFRHPASSCPSHYLSLLLFLHLIALTLSLPSPALCIHLITILSASCTRLRSLAFSLVAIFICLTFLLFVHPPGLYSQSSFTHNLHFLTAPSSSSSPFLPSLLPLLRNSFFLCMLIKWRDGYVGPFIRHVFY